jgi:hypothetical protein
VPTHVQVRAVDPVEQYQVEHMAAPRHQFVQPDFRVPDHAVAEWRMKERVRWIVLGSGSILHVCQWR